MSRATKAASVGLHTPEVLPEQVTQLLAAVVGAAAAAAVVQGARAAGGAQQKFPAESVRVLNEPEGQVPAPKQGIAEQQKSALVSFNVPVFLWPGGHVPAAVSGVASTPLPTTTGV